MPPFSRTRTAYAATSAENRLPYTQAARPRRNEPPEHRLPAPDREFPVPRTPVTHPFGIRRNSEPTVQPAPPARPTARPNASVLGCATAAAQANPYGPVQSSKLLTRQNGRFPTQSCLPSGQFGLMLMSASYRHWVPGGRKNCGERRQLRFPVDGKYTVTSGGLTTV